MKETTDRKESGPRVRSSRNHGNPMIHAACQALQRIYHDDPKMARTLGESIRRLEKKLRHISAFAPYIVIVEGLDVYGNGLYDALVFQLQNLL